MNLDVNTNIYIHSIDNINLAMTFCIFQVFDSFIFISDKSLTIKALINVTNGSVNNTNIGNVNNENWNLEDRDT